MEHNNNCIALLQHGEACSALPEQGHHVAHSKNKHAHNHFPACTKAQHDRKQEPQPKATTLTIGNKTSAQHDRKQGPQPKATTLTIGNNTSNTTD